MVYRIGIAPLSLKTIESITGVSKSTCNDIYKHALKNATAGRQNLHLERDRDRQQAACASAEEADVFLAGIEAQLNKINTEPGPGLEEKEEEIPLLELISADCLDSDARGGRTQALSEAEKDHLIATAKRDWGTRHMTLTEIQREAALCSFPFICAHPGLWAVYNM